MESSWRELYQQQAHHTVLVTHTGVVLEAESKGAVETRQRVRMMYTVRTCVRDACPNDGGWWLQRGTWQDRHVLGDLCGCRRPGRAGAETLAGERGQEQQGRGRGRGGALKLGATGRADVSWRVERTSKATVDVGAKTAIRCSLPGELQHHDEPRRIPANTPSTPLLSCPY
jgi:hypothetical protein